MLQPKISKYSKVFTKPVGGFSTKARNVVFGEYGLKAIKGAYVTSNQIEAVRMALSKYMKRKGKIWIRIFPDLPITSRPPSGMGGGKSPIDHWAAVVQKGRIIFEIGGVPRDVAEGAVSVAGSKLPMKIKLVEKQK